MDCLCPSHMASHLGQRRPMGKVRPNRDRACPGHRHDVDRSRAVGIRTTARTPLRSRRLRRPPTGLCAHCGGDRAIRNRPKHLARVSGNLLGNRNHDRTCAADGCIEPTGSHGSPDTADPDRRFRGDPPPVVSPLAAACRYPSIVCDGRNQLNPPTQPPTAIESQVQPPITPTRTDETAYDVTVVCRTTNRAIRRNRTITCPSSGGLSIESSQIVNIRISVCRGVYCTALPRRQSALYKSTRPSLFLRSPS